MCLAEMTLWLADRWRAQLWPLPIEQVKHVRLVVTRIAPASGHGSMHGLESGTVGMLLCRHSGSRCVQFRGATQGATQGCNPGVHMVLVASPQQQGYRHDQPGLYMKWRAGEYAMGKVQEAADAVAQLQAETEAEYEGGISPELETMASILKMTVAVACQVCRPAGALTPRQRPVAWMLCSAPPDGTAEASPLLLGLLILLAHACNPSPRGHDQPLLRSQPWHIPFRLRRVGSRLLACSETSMAPAAAPG